MGSVEVEVAHGQRGENTARGAKGLGGRGYYYFYFGRIRWVLAFHYLDDGWRREDIQVGIWRVRQVEGVNTSISVQSIP